MKVIQFAMVIDTHDDQCYAEYVGNVGCNWLTSQPEAKAATFRILSHEESQPFIESFARATE